MHDISNTYSSEEIKQNIINYFKENQVEEALNEYELFLKGKEVSWFLEQAINFDCPKAVDLALYYGADLNNYDQYSYSIVEKLITDHNLMLLEYMVEKGLNIFNVDQKIHLEDYKQKFIVLAGGLGTPEIIDYLVEQGLNVYSNNELAFAWSCSHGNINNIKHLIEKYNCKINNIIYSDLTPLSWATMAGQIDAIKLLLSYNADIDYNDNCAFMHCFKSTNSVELVLLYGKYCNLDQLQKMVSYSNYFKSFIGDDVEKRNEIEKLLTHCILEKTLKINKEKNNKVKI